MRVPGSLLGTVCGLKRAVRQENELGNFEQISGRFVTEAIIEVCGVNPPAKKGAL
jgi:hypothetical protein